MTDRIKGLTVFLEDDMHQEDAERIAEAIRCLRHVGSVELSVTTLEDYHARVHVRNELQKKLFKVLLDPTN
jgi:hypothetical protein